MDAITLLKEDHKNVNRLFRELDGQKGARKAQTGTRILNELEVHTQIEEEIFYPTLRELPDEKAQEMVKEAYEEHRLAKDVISELKRREPGDEMYDPQFKVLRESIEHHVEEEENEMFPHIRPLMRDQLTVLGTRMQARKRELQKGSGSVTATLRGLMNRAYEAVAGPDEKPKRKAKRATPTKTKAARRVTRARRSASAKVSSAKKSVKKSATRVRSAAKAVARKRPSTKSAAPKRVRGGEARRAGRRVASRKK